MNFAHFANWIAKVSLQTRQTKYCQDYANNIMLKVQDSLGMNDTDENKSQKAQDIFKQLNNSKAASIRAQYEKTKDKQIGKQYMLEVEKNVFGTALQILSDAKTYLFMHNSGLNNK